MCCGAHRVLSWDVGTVPLLLSGRLFRDGLATHAAGYIYLSFRGRLHHWLMSSWPSAVPPVVLGVLYILASRRPTAPPVVLREP